jgi:segregation and condensation protein A
MMSRASTPRPQIFEENWRVSDKIRLIRSLIQNKQSFALEELFGPEKSRLECIVTFLAILELMKIGEIAVEKQESNTSILLFAK